MSQSREFDDILNECIERVLKGETIESCLASFPEHAAELEPLLRTVVTTWNVTDILPRPEFRQRAANEFQAAIRDLKPRRRGTFVWQVRLVTAISVIVVILLAGTGTVAAAGNSQPDDPLYGVKLFTENVRVALTPSKVGKAELYAHFADQRVAEIIKMAEEGKVAQVEKATDIMNSNLAAIARLTQSATDTGAGSGEPSALSPTPEVAPTPNMTAAAPSALAITPSANVSPPPLIGGTIPTPPNTAGSTEQPVPTTLTTTTPNVSLASPPETTQRPTVPSGPTYAPPSQTPSPVQKITPTTAPTPEKAASANATGLTVNENTTSALKNNEKSELENTVSQQAIKNTEDLKEALNRVPDNVKPSVKKALDAAGKGYAEALKNISRRR
jgi:hypothetical protein